MKIVVNKLELSYPKLSARIVLLSYQIFGRDMVIIEA